MISVATVDRERLLYLTSTFGTAVAVWNSDVTHIEALYDRHH